MSRSIGLVLVGIGVLPAILIVFALAPSWGWTIGTIGIILCLVLALIGLCMLFVATEGTGALEQVQQEAAAAIDLKHAVDQLAKNYDILRRQATQGFILASAFMILGLVVIAAGAVGEMFGFSAEHSNLITVAGVIVEATSILGLYLFKQTSNQLNSTSVQLSEMWRILAAFRKAETLTDERRSQVTETLIYRLVGGAIQAEATDDSAEPIPNLEVNRPKNETP